MSIDTIQIMENAIVGAICILAFALILAVGLTYDTGKILVRAYERVNNHLVEQKRGLFHYDRTKEFLLSKGAPAHFGKWIDPVKFLAIQMVSAALLFCIGIGVHGALAVILSLIGSLIPKMMLIYLNVQDNDKMLPQIQTIYSAIRIQIEGGVYLTDALSECYGSIGRGRLRTALEELSGELLLQGSFEDSINHFNQKFDNGFIDSLCIIIKQAQESGQAVELLDNMSDQIKDMRSALLHKKKEQLERKTTLCILGVLAAILVIILYACVTSMFQAAGNL